MSNDIRYIQDILVMPANDVRAERLAARVLRVHTRVVESWGARRLK